ncbi:TetR/AcrR family transcriptional regulator [Allomesorhizobium alhagi]|jgi:AcrR family transcriptional regulator|uniref:Transcriptional regulator n=1 Tax=Mesorhizobium alhagi CCNWXJ12-2 TaxID=1107882 RepID=H0HVE9_9HYPH|nr:transcriptional regulator [Mesorhizobium alhagi CCNWXJ12-2]
MIMTENISASSKGRPRGFDRAEALRQAMRLFWAKGYDGASLADLTAVMGINPPSLYAAFGSKEALFREATDLYSETEGVDIWRSLHQSATARQAVEGFLRESAAAFSRAGDPPGCLIVLGALNANGNNAAICEDLRQRREANVAELRTRLEAAVREGELPAGIDCEAIAVFYVTVQQGMSIQARDGASHARLLAAADGAMAAWDALTAESSARVGG